MCEKKRRINIDFLSYGVENCFPEAKWRKMETMNLIIRGTEMVCIWQLTLWSQLLELISITRQILKQSLPVKYTVSLGGKKTDKKHSVMDHLLEGSYFAHLQVFLFKYCEWAKKIAEIDLQQYDNLHAPSLEFDSK